jgi:DNA-binding LytR/AlgR family response regulator
MLKIAIVDDDKKFIAIYRRIITTLFDEHHVKIELTDFYSGNEFVKSLSVKKYDLVFMDIDMPEMSGIDIAAELRKNNQSLDIIFVSAHPHFVFEAIRFTPYRFIRKTNFKAETKEAVDSYCTRTNMKFKMISLELQSCDTVSERINDIIQFFSVRHDIYYSLKNEIEAKCLSRKYSLSQLEQLTKDNGFLRVHKSYLLNYRYIKSINAKSVIMSSDDEIPISHGKKTEIQDSFMELLRKEEMI